MTVWLIIVLNLALFVGEICIAYGFTEKSLWSTALGTALCSAALTTAIIL